MNLSSAGFSSSKIMEDIYKTDFGAGDESARRLEYWKHVGYILFSICMVFGAHIGYVFQLFEMYKTRNVEGYSVVVSLILLTSNNLRILYYIGQKFALALLFQSIFAVIVHSLLILEVLHIIHNVLQKPAENVETPTQNGENFDLVNQTVRSLENKTLVEKLDNIAIYLEESILRMQPAPFLRSACMWCFITAISVLLYYVTIGTLWNAAPEVIGYLSLGIEALLVLPQILCNKRRSSTEGLTMFLVLTWCAGDVIKIVYFVLDHQPLPFIVCAAFQICLDVIVVGQVIYYRTPR